MSSPISISCASDANYFCGLLVTLHSLVSCATAERLVVHVLDMGLTDGNRQDLVRELVSIPGHSVDVRFHAVDDGLFSRFPGLPRWRGGFAAYARLLLHEILPEEQYTIYTDVDTLWLRDVSELWAMRMQVPVLAAVPDGSGLPELSSGEKTKTLFAAHGREIDADAYFCSGLLFMNLEELRRRDFTGQWVGFINEKLSLMNFPDQDLLNYLYPAPDTLLLDWRWGEFSTVYGMRGVEEPRVIHYARQTPWKKKITVANMLWWDYVCTHISNAKLKRNAWLRCFQYRLLRNSFFFKLVYWPLYFVNRRAYNKKRLSLSLGNMV